MKIIVDELPCNCEKCVFREYEMLRRYCTLTKYFTDKPNDRLHQDDEREEHCPLVELKEVINHIKE